MSIKKYSSGGSANLIDYTVSESGTITSTGVLEPNENCWRSTIYYEIDETKTYRASKAKNTIRICYYDSSKNFISREEITLENSKIITIPSGTKYIKWSLVAAGGIPCLDTVEDMKIMLSEGSEIIPYEPYGNTFKDWFYRKRETATDTITTFPKQIIADGTNASAGILGNMAYSGTQTPTSPIYPGECGEMTENMFDVSAFMQGVIPNRCTVDYNSTTNTITINATGNDAHTGNGNSYHIPVTGGETYTLSWTTNAVGGYVYIFENGLTDTTHLHDYNSSLKRGTLTAQSDTTYFVVRVGCNTVNETKTYTNIMLNIGSTSPSSYIPNGYKLDIKTGTTTTPVYLGETQSTRKIKKVVLTGQESGVWSYNPTITTGNAFYNENSTLFPNYDPQKVGYCTHYATTASASAVNEGIFWGANINFITDKNDGITTPAKWKQFLADQYSAGTPVTVWYILRNETTSVVNEPLRKIGTYADSVSVTGIPTTGTAEQFDVDTTLKPSEVDLTYHGWHEHSDTKFT